MRPVAVNEYNGSRERTRRRYIDEEVFNLCGISGVPIIESKGMADFMHSNLQQIDASYRIALGFVERPPDIERIAPSIPHVDRTGGVVAVFGIGPWGRIGKPTLYLGVDCRAVVEADTGMRDPQRPPPKLT